MRIGLQGAILGASHTYEELVEWAGTHGFESLEIDTTTPRQRGKVDPQTVLSGPEGRRRYLEPLRRHGIDLGSLMYYGPNNLDRDPEARRRAQEGLRDAMRAAAELGVPVVVTTIGNPVEHPARHAVNPWGIFYQAVPNAEGRRRRDEAIALAAESYRPLAEFAAAHGVRVAFEPSVYGAGAGAVAHSPETFDAFFELLDHPALGLNFDPSQLLWQGIDVVTYGERLAREGRLFSGHAKDGEILWERVRYVGFLGDGWWRHRLPGWGQVNWPNLIHRLAASGYDGCLHVEHEDVLFGYRTENLDEYKRGCLLSLEYLRHARAVAGH